MENTNATGNYYTIGHIVQFTGLTDRTIRNYIASGILKGEKINGLWHFTPEEVDAFLLNPAVRPSIVAKQHGVVYDFLRCNPETTDQICLVLDLPGGNRDAVTGFFCAAITEGDYRDIHFSFDGNGNTLRVFLKGEAGEVLRLVNGYYHG